MANRESNSTNGGTCPWFVQNGDILYGIVSNSAVGPQQILTSYFSDHDCAERAWL